MFTVDIEEFNVQSLGVVELEKILEFIEEHVKKEVPRIQKNQEYYLGEQEILKRTKQSSSSPNNKVVCNHAKLISDTATGFVFGNPIVYESKDGNDFVPELLKAIPENVDFENGLNASITGSAYELIYMREGFTLPTIKPLDSRKTFMVYDDTIEENEQLAVYYYEIEKGYRVNVFTANQRYIFKTEEGEIVDLEQESNPFGRIPVIKYRNNRYERGDFELQISLFDAYNKLMSDRVNDKEQFVDSILAIYGAVLGDDENESLETVRGVQENKFIELPEGSKAEYLTQTFNEQGLEVLRIALTEEIYLQSQVPNFSDENFSGNTSGVALSYKMFLLNTLANQKETEYKAGLRRRLLVISSAMNLFSLSAPNEQELYGQVDIKFNRNMPQNLLETVNSIVGLERSVSQQTLLGLLPFIENPVEEIERFNAEYSARQALEQQQFGYDAPTTEAPVDDTESME